MANGNSAVLKKEEIPEVVYSYSGLDLEENDSGNIFEVDPDKEDQSIIVQINWNNAWKETREKFWDPAVKQNLRGFYP